jgi:hypothetical protein
MDLKIDFLAAQGLSRYVRSTADELRLTGECSFAQLAPPVNAYLALDGRPSLFPSEPEPVVLRKANDDDLRAQLVSYARLDTVQAYPVTTDKTSTGGHR